MATTLTTSIGKIKIRTVGADDEPLESVSARHDEAVKSHIAAQRHLIHKPAQSFRKNKSKNI
jgi:hypothetical protein